MSWFPDEDFALESSSEAGEQLAEGVVVERRAVLRSSAALAGAWLLGSNLRAAPQDPSQTTSSADSFEAFVTAAQAQAEELIRAEQPNEDAYLYALCSQLKRIEALPAWPTPPEAESENASRPIRLARVHRDKPLIIIQIKMAPGSALPFHDHRDYNGILVGLEGRVRARNFEIVGDDPLPPAESDFQIRETQTVDLTPGRISTLSRSRDNIHDLRAGEEGGRLLDIFTHFPGKPRSVYMDVKDEPLDANRRIYSARWR